MIVKSCPICGRDFKAYGKDAKARVMCSRACKAVRDSRCSGEAHWKWAGGRKATVRRYRAKHRKARRLAGADRICKGCSKPFVKKGCVYHRECRPYSAKIVVACTACGTERSVWSTRPPPKLCRACDYANRAGERNGRWEGGITPDNRRLRASSEYQAWRKAVFERDGYRCVHCGAVGGQLHADHIKPFAAYPELRLTVDNGRTLCVECHKKTDTWLCGALKIKRARMKRAA